MTTTERIDLGADAAPQAYGLFYPLARIAMENPGHYTASDLMHDAVQFHYTFDQLAGHSLKLAWGLNGNSSTHLALWSERADIAPHVERLFMIAVEFDYDGDRWYGSITEVQK